MNNKKLAFLLVVLLAIAALAIKQCKQSAGEKPHSDTSEWRDRTPGNARGLNRDVTLLNYSKHAKCRMECRQISQSEVEEILKKGNINYKKSDLQDARGPEYAVEGFTSDRQKVRIIFAQKKTRTTVVTVIDLENEWSCPSCN